MFLHCSWRSLLRHSLVAILSVAVLQPVDVEIKVRPRSIDLGERGHNETASAVFQLTSYFHAPVYITRLKPTCSCLKLTPMKLPKTVAPGATLGIRVSMNSGRAIGTLTKYVEIDVNGDAGPITRLRVPVTMRVFDGYRLEPREFHFAGQVGGQSVTSTVLVESKKKKQPGDRLDLRFVRITDRDRPSTRQFFDVRIIDHDKGANIAVTLSSEHPEGRFSCDLEAVLDGKPLVLPIFGDMFRGIMLTPKFFNFNRVEARVLTTQVEESVLSSIDGQAFKILSMKSQVLRPRNATFSLGLETEPRSGGREHLIRARLVTENGFPAKGSFSGKVMVTTSHSEKPQMELNFFGFFATPKLPGSRNREPLNQ